jgi:hypothetical protein
MLPTFHQSARDDVVAIYLPNFAHEWRPTAPRFLSLVPPLHCPSFFLNLITNSRFMIYPLCLILLGGLVAARPPPIDMFPPGTTIVSPKGNTLTFKKTLGIGFVGSVYLASMTYPNDTGISVAVKSLSDIHHSTSLLLWSNFANYITGTNLLHTHQ